MNNKKGFTLIEIMAVVIIIGILAALSIPNLIGYARDSRNDRAKTALYNIAQGYKSFRNDFAWVSVSPLGPLAKQNLTEGVSTQSCNINNFTGTNPTAGFATLIQCSYIDNIDYDKLRYKFYLGNGNGACSACGSATPTTDLACMVGNDSGPYVSTYCAYIDSNNMLHETAI